jgi:hypothetical protein
MGFSIGLIGPRQEKSNAMPHAKGNGKIDASNIAYAGDNDKLFLNDSYQFLGVSVCGNVDEV